MSVYNSLEYKRAVKEELRLRKFLSQLDTIGEILYNNLEYNGIWELIDKFEDIRLGHYITHYEYDTIVKNKGRMNGKR